MATERSGFPELLKKTSYQYYFEEYDRHDTVYDKLFTVKPSDSAWEQQTTSLRAGKLSEVKEGSEILASNPLEGFTVYGKNRKYGDSIELTLELVEDTPTEKIMNIVQDIAKGWGEGVVISKEEFAATFFNKGGFTAGYDSFNNTITGNVTDPTGALCYDGKPFFNLSNNTRSSKAGGTYYNGLALALSSANLQTAYNLMTNTNNRNERDEVVAIKPSVLVIPPALRFTAKNILEADNVVGSANNDINVTKNLVTPVEWHYLSDSDAWFLGVPQKGLVWLERKQPVIDAYQDEKTKNYYVTIYARWGAMMTNWRYWVGSNFSTS
jgi:hypothetical protein